MEKLGESSFFITPIAHFSLNLPKVKNSISLPQPKLEMPFKDLKTTFSLDSIPLMESILKTKTITPVS